MRAERIELSTKRWQRLILPLNYARMSGCQGRDRTYDQLINSQLLLPLSYLAILLVGYTDIALEQVDIAVYPGLFKELVLYTDIGIFVVVEPIVCTKSQACQNQQYGYVFDILDNGWH